MDQTSTQTAIGFDERAERTMAFVMRLGRSLHSAGTPAHRLEAALSSVSERLGLEAQFLSTPTSLLAAFGPEGRQRTGLVRVEPGDVDLARLDRLNRVADEVTAGTLGLNRGLEELRAIERMPHGFGLSTRLLSFVLTSAAVAIFLGATLGGVLAAGLVGLLVGGLVELSWRHHRSRRLTEFGAGFLAAALALGAQRVLGASAETVTLAGLIVLVPGLTLTLSMNELATRHLISGGGRLLLALMILISMGFGVALGWRLEPAWAAYPGATVSWGAVEMPTWAVWVALAVTPINFVVLFRARWSHVWTVAIASWAGFAGARAGAAWLGPELGVSVGSLAVGLWGNFYGRALRRPAAIPMLPGIMLLVPGSLGFQSLSALLGQDALGGVETAFLMVMIAVSLVAGLLLANMLLEPRRAL